MSLHVTAVLRRLDPLILLPVGLYLLLSSLYLWAVPIGESPDEPGHVQCLQQVALEKRLPQMRSSLDETIDWWARENIFSEYMCYHMPTYYVIGGWLARWLSLNEAVVYPATNPRFGEGDPAMFMQTPQASEQMALTGLRWLSVLFGLTTLGVSYTIAHRLFPQQRVVPLIAMTLVAGWPQFLFISRAISNDALATTVAVLILLILTDVGKPKRFVWAAILSILAFLTKLSVAFTVGVVPLVWALEWVILRGRKRPYLQAIGGMAVIWLFAGLFIYLSPAIWANWRQSAQDFGGFHWGVTSVAYWQQVYAWTIQSGWAWFGWLTLSPPPWHAQMWWLFIELATITGAYLSFKETRGRNGRFRLLILALWWTAVAISYMRVTANRWQPQFRFALAVLPLLVSFTAVAVAYPLRHKTTPQWALWLVLILGLLTYNLWLILAVILPAYS